MANLPKIKNCPGCNQLYIETGQHMCRECYALREEKARVVIRYVKDHPKATVEEIVEATEIELEVIQQLIKEGRLEEVGLKIAYPCSRCGKPILRGKICPECKASLHKALTKVKAAIEANEMREKERRRHLEFLRAEGVDSTLKKRK
ncbi:MAG: flagellar protein [Selenomonadaceae bacterium]|nr:flagellar protein [Selenomonadaceae bacterium]